MSSTDERQQFARPQPGGTEPVRKRPFGVASVTVRNNGDRKGWVVVLLANREARTADEVTRRPVPGPGQMLRPSPTSFPQLRFDPDSSWEAERTTRTRWVWPAVLLLVAVLLVAAIFLFVKTYGDDAGKDSAATRSPVASHAQRAATPTLAEVRAATLTWVRGNLPRSAVIAADSSITAALRQAGHPYTFAFGTQHIPRVVRYVVDASGYAVSGRRAQVERRQGVARSIPLAIFGSGRVRMTVRELVSIDLALAHKRALYDVALREAAGRDLLSDVMVFPDEPTDHALREGAVDLRAEKALGTLAADAIVYVTDPVSDVAERQAGRPIRSLVISTDDIDATLATLRGLRAPYRPARVRTVTPGSLLVVWSAALPATIPVVG